MAAQFYVPLNPGFDVRVTIPPEIERQIAASFLSEVRAEADRAGQRYAPNNRGFLLELRERVLVGIEPGRLSSGGVRSFVDKVGYRMWEERRRTGATGGLAPAEQVTPPPRTGEMPAVRP